MDEDSQGRTTTPTRGVVPARRRRSSARALDAIVVVFALAVSMIFAIVSPSLPAPPSRSSVASAFAVGSSSPPSSRMPPSSRRVGGEGGEEERPAATAGGGGTMPSSPRRRRRRGCDDDVDRRGRGSRASPPPSSSRRRSLVASSPTLLLPIALLAASPPPAARSMTPGDATSYYDAYAPTYDDLDGGRVASSLGIDDARKSLLGDVDVVRGRVLEVGAGTGLNLGSYRGLLPSSGRDGGGGGGGGGNETLPRVDVSGGMLDEARARWEGMRSVSISSREDVVPVVVEFVRADATSELMSLFGEGVFDVAVDTFGLCVMGDDGARRCLREMTGVVKKGGERERERDMRRDVRYGQGGSGELFLIRMRFPTPPPLH